MSMQNMPGKYQVAFSTNGPAGYNLWNPQEKRQHRKAKKKYNIHTTSDEKITPDPIVGNFYSYKGHVYECTSASQKKRTGEWFYEFVRGKSPDRPGFFFSLSEWKTHVKNGSIQILDYEELKQHFFPDYVDESMASYQTSWCERMEELRRSHPGDFKTMTSNREPLTLGGFYWNVISTKKKEIHRLVEANMFEYELHGPYGEFDIKTGQIKEYDFEEYLKKKYDSVFPRQ